MRRWGLAGVTALGLAVSLASAQPPSRQGKTTAVEQPGWWSGLFGGKAKEKQEGKKSGPPPAPVLTQQARAEEHERLMKAYQRREAVCDRLREIALQTNDAALEEEAARLLDLAMKLYREQSSKLLGVVSLTMEDEEPPAERPARNSAASLRSGPVPPRIRSGGSLRPESDRQRGGTWEGER